MQHHRPDPRGVALCLASAAGFGAMAIFAKEAYDGGASIPTLLAVRFGLAAVVLWALVARAARRATPRRVVASSRLAGRSDGSTWAGLALGVLYAVEATAWFVALSRIDAALAELLLYLYPALVVLGAALLGRERLTRGRVQALVLSSVGIALVLAAGEMSTVDTVGVLAAVASAVLYSTYTLVSDRVIEGRDPLLVSAQVVTGAALCFLGYGAVTGSIDLGLSAQGWVATLSLTLLSTVVPILAFLKGIQLVGVGTATILSTAEPVVTIGLAMVVLGERLAPVQLLGGAFVLGALALLTKAPASVPAPHEPAPHPSPAAPAREAREGVAVG